ncbi:hypothetical protein [Campylobacter hepaticus]
MIKNGLLLAIFLIILSILSIAFIHNLSWNIDFDFNCYFNNLSYYLL